MNAARPLAAHRLAWLLLAALALGALPAHAQDPGQAVAPLDWRAEDVNGRAVDTKSFRGKLLLVFINAPATKGKARALTEQLAVRYGDHAGLGQLTIVDLSEAPLTWRGAETISGTVSARVREAQAWTVENLQKTLAQHHKPPIEGLEARLHVVLDWDGELVTRYRPWDTARTITVALIDKEGRPLANYRVDQRDELFAAIDDQLEKAP